MVMDGDAGQSKIITYRTAGLQRFGLYVNNTAESGSNAGSDFAIRAYSDAGTLLNTPVFIKRSTGNVGIGTNAPISPLNIQSDTQNVGILSVTTSGGGTNRFQVWNTNSVSTPVWNIGLPSPDTRIGMFTNISFRANGTEAAVFSSNEASFGSISGARLGIRGTGSTSATTSLLVQNSAGTQLAILNDAGNCIIGTGSPSTFRLEVTGTTRLNGLVTCDSNITLVAGNSVLSCGIIKIGNGSSTANIITDNIKPISMFPTTGVESFRLFENGNLLLQQGGTFSDVPSSKCTINSTTQGFLPPRMTTAQKNAIATPAIGLMLFDTDLGRPCFYNGAWVTL
jgi:hypothetical protein